MAKVLNSTSVSARRAKAIALIKAGVVHSQSDLVKLLKKAGFEVTQATASRDLEEVGAVRSRNSVGELIYQIGTTSDGAISKSIPLPSDLILSVEPSGNLAVVRTPPGGAQFLASALDNSGISSIIGTIAGDDTVLVVSKKSNGGAELAKELLSFSRTSNKSTGRSLSGRKARK
ncbi:MAG: arginine repressor [Candidatus Planktophila sp.]|nr:arginine repressor [Candidatus Planktophila sp.]